MQDDLTSMARGDDDGVSVHTGFPNPAIDRRGQTRLTLDLNQLLVRHPSSTYLFRISGHQWVDQGVYDGDVAVIDRALAPNTTDLILSRELSGFRLGRRSQIMPDDTVWGVVTAIIHQYTGRS